MRFTPVRRAARALSAAASGAAACVGCAAAMAVSSSAAAGLVYQSGTLGPTGQSAGFTLNATNFTGVRFQLLAPATADRIGGNLSGADVTPSATLFGALVHLSGPGDVPDSVDLSTPDVLASAVLTVPHGSADVFETFATTPLAAGWYAMVFGSGRFGATGAGAAVTNNPPVGSPSYFFQTNGGNWTNSTSSGMRFVLAGPSGRFWINKTGGNWNAGSNWSPNSVPDTFEDINFEAGAAYTVTLDADHTVHTISIEGQGERATLNMAGHVLTSTGSINLSPGSGTGTATIDVTNGTLLRPTNHDIVVGGRSPGVLNVTGSGVISGAGASRLIVGDRAFGTLTIANGSVSTYTGRVADEPTFSDGSPSGGMGAVNINAAGTWTVGGDLLLGRNGQADVTINPGGTLYVGGTTRFYSGTGGQLVLQGGTLHTGYLDTSNEFGKISWTSGTLQIGQGTLEINSNGPLGDNPVVGNGKVLVTDGGIHIASPQAFGGSLTVSDTGFLSSPLTNDGQFTINFATALVPSPSGLVGNGHTTVDNGTLTAERVRQLTLAISGNSLVALTIDNPLATSIVSRMGPLTITDTGRLDLSNKRLILVGADAGSWNGSGYTGITGLIASGHGPAGGTLWDGTSGIITSQSNATAGNFTSIGIATGAQAKNIAPGGPSQVWSGEFISSTSVLIMYTYGGDANLDGKINVDDYGHIDTSIPLGLSGWFNGDFNYDGKINVDDYGIIDFNIGIQGAPFPTVSSASAGLSAVPEPASILAATILLTPLLTRRRRKRIDVPRGENVPRGTFS